MTSITPSRILAATAALAFGVPTLSHYQETVQLSQERAAGLRVPTSPMDRESCLGLLQNPAARFHVVRATDTHYAGHPGVQESAHVDGRVVLGRQSCDLRITAEAVMNHGLFNTRGECFTWYDRAECLSDRCGTRSFPGFVENRRIVDGLTAGLTIAFRLGVADEF